MTYRQMGETDRQKDKNKDRQRDSVVQTDVKRDRQDDKNRDRQRDGDVQTDVQTNKTKTGRDRKNRQRGRP